MGNLCGRRSNVTMYKVVIISPIHVKEYFKHQCQFDDCDWYGEDGEYGKIVSHTEKKLKIGTKIYHKDKNGIEQIAIVEGESFNIVDYVGTVVRLCLTN